jgi:hypothetical protein
MSDVYKLRNYKELALTREQLTRAEDALVSLHQEVYAKNPRNYTIYAEAYVDMIKQLRAQIDAFLGIDAPPPDDPDLTSNGATDNTAETALASPAAEE